MQLPISSLLAPTTLFSYDTQALVSFEAFHSHSSKTSSLISCFYQVFLPSCLLFTSLSLLHEWVIRNNNNSNTTHPNDSRCPFLYWASGHKAAGQETEPQECQQAPASLRTPICPESSTCNTHNLGYHNAMGDLHVLDVTEVTRHLAQLLTAKRRLSLHAACWLTRYEIHNRFPSLMD